MEQKDPFTITTSLGVTYNLSLGNKVAISTIKDGDHLWLDIIFQKPKVTGVTITVLDQKDMKR